MRETYKIAACSFMNSPTKPRNQSGIVSDLFQRQTMPTKHHEEDSCGMYGEYLCHKPFLEEKRINIQKYQDSLRSILNVRGTSERLARWKLHYREIDFDVFH